MRHISHSKLAILYTVLIVCIPIIIVDYNIILKLHSHVSIIISRYTHSITPVFHVIKLLFPFHHSHSSIEKLISTNTGRISSLNFNISMTHSKIEALLLLNFVIQALVKDKQASPTAVITPRGYIASLDTEFSFNFYCDVTGADGIRWIVDGLLSTRPEIRNRGVRESELIIVNATTGSLRRSISIERNITNQNTFIICQAESISSAGVSSEPVLFKIQGLLDAPSNLMLSEADNQHMRRLIWDEPFSLDITDIEPDISHYNVYYSLVNANKSHCMYL